MKKPPYNTDLFENADANEQVGSSKSAETSTHEDANEVDTVTNEHFSKSDLEGALLSNGCAYLSVVEVAKRYSVSPATIWRYLKDRSNPFPPPYRLSKGTTRWKLSELFEIREGFAAGFPNEPRG